MLSFQPVESDNFQLPPSMADTAPPIDKAYDFIFWFSVVFTVAITAALLYFVMKYRRRPGVKPEPTGHFMKLELFWTITPTIFIFFLFHAGFTGYIRNATAAEGATEIRVRGKKWSWEFEYPTGDREPGELTLELGRPYKMIISSEDVLHSFYIPEFRMKRDAVPGQYSFIQFTPTKAGTANVFCAEYCGTSHSGMLATVKILPPAEYKEWEKKLGDCQGGEEECAPAKWGERLFVKNGCPTCHGAGGTGEIGGSKTPGPKLAGLFGRDENTTAGPVHVDENYLRESILRPNAKIVAGYASVQMPPFVMKDKQLDAVIAYIKSLK
ncbi:MAG: cytochrome c oxidase subunit II [Labilithrix sp.]|nr:cytochrome c oxidase subunit II [Labilithrix sp.]